MVKRRVEMRGEEENGASAWHDRKIQGFAKRHRDRTAAAGRKENGGRRGKSPKRCDTAPSRRQGAKDDARDAIREEQPLARRLQVDLSRKIEEAVSPFALAKRRRRRNAQVNCLSSRLSCTCRLEPLGPLQPMKNKDLKSLTRQLLATCRLENEPADDVAMEGSEHTKLSGRA